MPFFNRSLILSFIAALAVSPFAQAAGELDEPVGERLVSSKSEELLMRSLDFIAKSKPNEAIKKLKALQKINPDFDLAQVVYADLLLSKQQKIKGFGNSPSQAQAQVNGLRDEMRARWQYYKSPIDKGLIPEPFVKLSDTQDYVLIADQMRQRLFLYQNVSGVPVYVDDFYITIGKNGAGKIFEGDKKTPLGVYFVTRFIEPAELPDFYGEGAFPINYPNSWDKKNGRTGQGIWLHGTPLSVFSRPPKDSNGCVIISNDVLKRLIGIISTHQVTPLILAKKINWQTPEYWQASQQSFMKIHDKWRMDWESGDSELYLSHYSKQYSAEGKSYTDWAQHKRAVNKNKSYIRVQLSDISLLAYPGDTDEIFVATFNQKYASNNYQGVSRKRQYWRLEQDNVWRIIFEGNI